MKLPEPKYTLEFDSRGRSNVIMDYRGSDPVPIAPMYVKCDFCCREVGRLFCWRVRPVGVEVSRGKHMVYDGGRWNACDECEPMLEFLDVAALVARVKSVNEEVRIVPAADLDRLYRAIFDAMVGGFKLWQSGEKWPISTQKPE